MTRIHRCARIRFLQVIKRTFKLRPVGRGFIGGVSHKSWQTHDRLGLRRALPFICAHDRASKKKQDSVLSEVRRTS